VCTIRTTPSQPIHCIVWAKSYLFAEIFGQSEDAAEEMDHTEDAENVKEIEKLKEESRELSRLRQAMSSEDFSHQVFEKIFSTDIKRLREMEDAWKSRSPPEVLSFDELSAEAGKLKGSVRQDDQRAWSRAESFQVFRER
jgi:ubiquitin-like 1-activating enzyme E1 B